MTRNQKLIQDADAHEKDLTAFVVKRKNIYLSRDKYYADKGTAAPDFTRYLSDKNMRKYQEKLAKKGVSAKINKKDVKAEKENLVMKKPSEKRRLGRNRTRRHRQLSKKPEAKKALLASSSNKTETYKQQELKEDKPHEHIWSRTWRKRPKVRFQRAD